MKISEVVKYLNLIKEDMGDIEVKVESPAFFEELREVYLLFPKQRIKQRFAALSKDLIGYRGNWKRRAVDGTKVSASNPEKIRELAKRYDNASEDAKANEKAGDETRKNNRKNPE